jgi:hypothetical protein
VVLPTTTTAEAGMYIGIGTLIVLIILAIIIF